MLQPYPSLRGRQQEGGGYVLFLQRLYAALWFLAQAVVAAQGYLLWPLAASSGDLTVSVAGFSNPDL